MIPTWKTSLISLQKARRTWRFSERNSGIAEDPPVVARFHATLFLAYEAPNLIEFEVLIICRTTGGVARLMLR